MNNHRLVYALLCLCGWAVAAPVEKDDVSGTRGQVQVYGTLVSTACELRMDTIEQTVDLGMVSAAAVSKQGDRSVGVPFRLVFSDCLLGAYAQPVVARRGDQFLARADGVNTDLFLIEARGATLTFVGEADEVNPALLKVSGDASGVGVRVTDAEGRLLSLNQANKAYILSPGENVLTFFAGLEATAGVGAGEFRAVLNLRVSYL